MDTVLTEGWLKAFRNSLKPELHRAALQNHQTPAPDLEGEGTHPCFMRLWFLGEIRQQPREARTLVSMACVSRGRESPRTMVLPVCTCWTFAACQALFRRLHPSVVVQPVRGAVA